VEIRDPVHGSIRILDEEIPIIRNSNFGRMRGIKQLGLSEFVFPGATHTRFIHAIGVMSIGEKAFDKLFHKRLFSRDIQRIKETFKLACLLHDIGHAPLSHATESAMPQLKELGIPRSFFGPNEIINRQAGHEDYTVKSIIDGPLTESFAFVTSSFGVEPNYIAKLVIGHCEDRTYFTIDGIDYFPILTQLISSEMDCDRMDYLLRDSYFCGVSYGHFDLDWLIDNLDLCYQDGQAFLGISERAIVTFDDFLLSRFHMFLMVYFHYRSVCLEQMLIRFFETAPGEYRIPSNIEEYLEHDDHYLMKVLRLSKNRYAQDIVQNKIPEKIYESFNKRQLETLNKLEAYLVSENIELIKCSSKSRISKYYTSEGPKESGISIKVIRKISNSNSMIISNIEDATDLFKKFSSEHEVTRLHCRFSELSKKQQSEIAKIGI